MSAREITRSLKGQWHGSYGMVRCVAHDDGKEPGLKVWDYNNDVFTHCFAGCDWKDIKAELRRQGLLAEHDRFSPRREVSKPRPSRHPYNSAAEAKTREKVRRLWDEGQPIEGSVGEVYFREARGITIPIPPAIRFHPALPYWTVGDDDKPTVLGEWPSLLCAITNATDELIGVERIYLKPDGSGKAKLPDGLKAKKGIGHKKGGRVELGASGTQLGLAEGIETALSATQLFGDVCWAALGGQNLKSFVIPRQVTHFILFVDNGDPGHKLAREAACEFEKQGRPTWLVFPKPEFGDFNNQLKATPAEYRV